MIDTVRFKIESSPKQIKSIPFSAISKEKAGNLLFKFFRDNVPVGSYSYDVNIFIPPSSNAIFVEYSVPKLLFGNNVKECSFVDVLDSAYVVHSVLDKYIPNLLLPEAWEFYRIDFCKNWKIPIGIDALNIILMLQSLTFPRKKKYLFDSSVMFKGRTMSLKFYLKHDEYIKHDFNKLLTIDSDVAIQAYRDSQQMLRFELTMRHEYLQKLFNLKNIYLLDLQNVNWSKVMNKYLSNFDFLLSNNVTKDFDILRTLESHYSKGVAHRVFMFYNIFYGNNQSDKIIYKNSTSRQTIFRYQNYLKKCGIGLRSSVEIPFNIKLQV